MTSFKTDTALRRFLSDESGAVTVDWVVLTAALVGLGLAVMGVVSTGVQSASNSINGQLTSDTLIQTQFENRNTAAAGQTATWEADGFGNGAQNSP